MYYVIANQIDGELVQVSTSPLTPVAGQILKIRGGDIPDLNKFIWHGGSLAFIEKLKVIDSVSFLLRFTKAERKEFLKKAKTNEDVELFYEYINIVDFIVLDDVNIIADMQVLVTANVITSERATQIIS